MRLPRVRKGPRCVGEYGGGGVDGLRSMAVVKVVNERGEERADGDGVEGEGSGDGRRWEWRGEKRGV